VLEFFSTNEDPKLENSRCQGSLNATISGETDQVYLGQNGFFLASMSCVKVFRSTFRVMSFQDMHWLQTLGPCKASFGAKVV